MTTLIDNHHPGPALHALVVGVGDYPHLPGGPQHVVGDAADTWGLGQLSSPPLSAFAFLDWLLDEFKLPAVGPEPARPLGSVEAVVSQVGGLAQYRGKDLERASYASFVVAFNRFFARANTHEDSIALFYFCGHGVQKGAWTGLVFDDFNSQPLSLRSHVLNYGDFELGMDQCLARRQVFVLDACRNTPKKVLEQVGEGKGMNPVEPAEPPTERDRHYPVYRATTSNQPAYALSGRPSRFTQALLRALRGSACEPVNGGWAVQADTVVRYVSDLLALDERLNTLPHQEARPTGSSLEWVLHVPGKPVVPVVVGCTPPSDNTTASFSLLSGEAPFDARGPDPSDWILELAIADYKVLADFPNGQAQRSAAVLARPPFSEVRL